MPWRQITSGGISRRYFSYAPDNVTDQTVVVGLHGGGGTPFGFAGQADLQDFSDQRGFKVLLPEGTSRTWNVGDGQGGAERNGIDDVRFIQDMLENENISGDVVLFGHSKGGMLAYKVASEVPGLVRGIGAVAATLINQADSHLTGVQLVHIHGKLDDRVPLQGDGTDHRPPVYSGIREFIDDNLYGFDWRRREVEEVPDGRIISVDSSLDDKVYAVLYEVTEGGHNFDVSIRANETAFILDRLL